MIRDDRVLLAVLVGAALLVILALALFFARRGGEGYLLDDSPRGVLQNYIAAVRKRDYERAYAYLASMVPSSLSATYGFAIPDQGSFLRYFQQDSRASLTNVEVEVDGETFTANEAVVSLTLVEAGRSPSRRTENAYLVKENGAWKIVGGPSPFWSYDWTVDYSPGGSPPVKPPSSILTP